jgi:serine/threonine protein kinase
MKLSTGAVIIVAVKVMAKNSKSAKRSVEQGRELNILKQLTGLHPNIIQLLAWRETHFNFQLVFPFVHQDLRKFIAHHAGLVPIEAARDIGSQLFSALVFMHKRSIMHRDIKPENILVQSQPMAAQLSDFGAARTLLPPISTGTREPLTPDVCTLWYRAPEILLAHDTYSFPADVWSLGMSIAHIELGHSPFRQSTEIGMMFDICKALGPPAGGSPLAKFCFGVMGKPLFPSFKAAGGAWGNRYGMAFGLWLNNIAKLPPCGRCTPTHAQQLQW